LNGPTITICDPEPQVLCCLLLDAILYKRWFMLINMVMHNHELLEKLPLISLGNRKV
ncbi:hypothetical protein ACJX0J_013691, partial [Zea mays]